LVGEAFDGGLDQDAVARLILIELVIDDDAFAGLAEPEFVAEVSLGTGFSTPDDVGGVISTRRVTWCCAGASS